MNRKVFWPNKVQGVLWDVFYGFFAASITYIMPRFVPHCHGFAFELKEFILFVLFIALYSFDAGKIIIDDECIYRSPKFLSRFLGSVVSRKKYLDITNGKNWWIGKRMIIKEKESYPQVLIWHSHFSQSTRDEIKRILTNTISK
ncbi:MAG: hypothetical protein A3G33_03085 [Omnitrophica bacterium RIFCSPLOWO2_12_FULL_44_17]|uniref:Uncharacterized protein n=1 Tax=Candidatus Danuiimicrobium aquiferis TaxID=1801832 RepID=A0A1G1KQW8_9BACT|nr:MAG: hypothetical protein A3B72_01840 [Omnitrophica bacterium RIFCSPHIGHO2_02_FULL_45_28]OGW92447.1 MAG: hypothetical protein A3E74_04420 [Omnitrophica bacterium RIFCSPHIGHO2_12_FULL_44_12]OGW95321.1 MAG: hypothetical protein A3G33_03085 [Omnitrophica bacterium RIFCSPLOWO2_12_FULL_44_17]OGX04724.1 MAG: hypothetical protein A3J12_09115 [Omnitrophica bacterium RIFCSPLOWO2_02_FULL_44_11]